MMMRAFAAVLVLMTGCMATDDDLEEEDIAEDTAAIGTNCPPNEPPCVCVLKGTSACKDPDGDGILSLYDNCDFTANRTQVNCDGDTYGDACDPENVIVSTSTQLVGTDLAWSQDICVGDDLGEPGGEWSRDTWVSTYNTTTTRQFCGPSGNHATSSVSQSFVTSACFYRPLFPFSCPDATLLPVQANPRCIY